MNRHPHRAIGFAAAIGVIALVLLYGGRTMLATAAILSSSAVVMALLAHAGIVAAIVAPVLTWRHRMRHRNRSSD